MRNGTPRLRHLRHSRLERNSRNENLDNFLADKSDELDGTGTGKTFTATAATDVLAINAHGYDTGAGPFVASSSGTLPAGLAAATLYWAVKVDANGIKLAKSLKNAKAGKVVDITDTGSGTHTLTPSTTENAIYERMRKNKAETVAAATDVDSLR